MVESYFEVTLIDSMTDEEFDWLGETIHRENKWDSTMNASGRILVIEGPEDVQELISMLAQLQFADDVGHIRQITDYTVEREMIAVEFES